MCFLFVIVLVLFLFVRREERDDNTILLQRGVTRLAAEYPSARDGQRTRTPIRHTFSLYADPHVLFIHSFSPFERLESPPASAQHDEIIHVKKNCARRVSSSSSFVCVVSFQFFVFMFRVRRGRATPRFYSFCVLFSYLFCCVSF